MKTLMVFLSFLFFALSGQVVAQDSLSLADCHAAAARNYPLIKQKQLLSDASNLRMKNISAGYLPRVDFNGQATLQSDVTEITMPEPVVDLGTSLPPGFQTPKVIIPAMDSPDKDQYKLTLDVSQIIYDGGMTKAQREMELAGLYVDTQQVTVSMHQVKERINQTYFSILLLQDKINLTDTIRKDLSEKIKTLESGLKNGAVLPSAIDVLKAERLKLDQQALELRYAKKAAYKILSELMGESVPETRPLCVPQFDVPVNGTSGRPEYKFFELQEMRLSAAQVLVSRKSYPKLSGFAQAGYGKPGLNLFTNEFDTYCIIGARLSWNVWDWKQNSREKKILDVQKSIIANQREVFDKNLVISLENEAANIEKYTELLKMDEELVALRSSITQRSYSQMQNGVITTTEYLTDLTSETQARMSQYTHRLQLAQAKLNYLTIKGNI